MTRPRLGHALIPVCALLGVVLYAGPAELREVHPAEDPPDLIVLDVIKRHPPLQQLFSTRPDLAREIARRLLTLEMQDGLGTAPGDGETASPGQLSPKGSSPQAVLDLIELMRAVAEETKVKKQ